MPNRSGQTPEEDMRAQAVKIARLETRLNGLPDRVRGIEMKLAVIQVKMAGIVFLVALAATVLGNVLARHF